MTQLAVAPFVVLNVTHPVPALPNPTVMVSLAWPPNVRVPNYSVSDPTILRPLLTPSENVVIAAMDRTAPALFRLSGRRAPSQLFEQFVTTVAGADVRSSVGTPTRNR